MKFGGSAGLFYDLPSSADLSEYSMSVWVRVSSTPAELSRPLNFVTLKPGFDCYFNIRFRIQCDSDSASSNIQIEGAVRMNNWYVFTLRSKSGQTLTQLRELSNTIFSYSNSGSFFPFGASKLTYNQVYVGINADRRSKGFVGNIRNLKVFSIYYDDASLWRAQFTYLTPYGNLAFQVILGSLSDVTDDSSTTAGTVVGTASQLTNVIDYSANFFCYLSDSTDSQSGTIDQALQFDGISCKDNKEKLYMTDDKSYVNSKFTAATDLKGYTVEFWVRPTSTVSGDAFLLVIQEPRTSSLYTVISQLTTNQLYCYTSYSQNQTSKVKFLDYASELRSWQHMGCIVDTVTGFVQGVFYNSQYDYVYYEEINSNAFLPKQEYNIYLNSDPRQSRNGIPQSHYAEMRIWNYARSTQDLKNYQFHQLNVDRFRVNLLSYWKLMSGGAVQNPGEIDYSDSSLSKQLTLTNTQWQARNDITICPFGTFKGASSDLNCYREMVTKFLIFVVKNSTHYTITPFYTIFRNSMIRDDNRQLFNFTWTLTSMSVNNQTNQNVFNSYYSFQKARKELIFSYDQVSNMPGKYYFDVTMADMNQQIDMQKGSITLATYKCLSIFDKATQQSVRLMDMDSKRLSEDHLFFYDFTQCGNYVFDQNSMTIDIDYSDKILLLNTDHNKEKKSFTLRAGVQQYLPLNEYFYIRMKGVWRNSNDRNDVIEYYLIYGCRYISKLVPKIKPNYFLVLRGQELVISYEAAFYNMPSNIQDRTWKGQWVCPQAIDVYCKNQGDQLRLPYNIFLNSGLPFWQAHQIKLILTTNFIQGDGSKESIGTIDIVWSDVNPDAQAMIVSPINKEYNTGLQVNIVNMPEDDLTIEWTSNPAVPTNCQLNSNNRKQFVINPTCISEGVDYNVTCNVFYLKQNQVIWQSSNIFRIPISPRGGRIQCDRTSGKAYLDQFSCSTTGWTLQTSTARYQFMVTDLITGNYIILSGLINQQTFVTTLPPTNRLTVKVVDTNGGIAYATLTVSVTYAYETAILTKVQTLVSTAQDARDSATLQSMVACTQASALINNIGNTTIQTTTGRDILDYQRNISETILFQSLNLRAITDENVRRSFIQGAVSSIFQLTKNPRYFEAQNGLNMINAMYNLINGSYSDSLQNLMYDQSFNTQFFGIYENVYTSLKILLDKSKITNAIMDAPPANNETLSNLTKKAKGTLGVYERLVSIRIFENQTFLYNNSVFSFMVTKFSRMAKHQSDRNAYFTNGQYASYEFPLSDATQPTARQSFAVMNFKISPFIGDWYLNQTATSDTSVYFSYRDENGGYLSSDNVIRRIKITYKYAYSPFIFLPNVTTCGYIGLGESQWENKSCTVEFSRVYSQITCHCLHMSYYSIIDDYLVRPQKVPLVYLTFRNWSSFIVILYMILIFVIGTIYTFNKDNQDFRYLHEQEELQGNTLSSENSVNLISLTFKRKVFFMMFAEKYKFSNLIKLYLMLLHPVFQLKYRLDPEHPRFYRFLLLYSRIMILFAICFFILKDVANFEELMGSDSFGITIFEVIILIILGSLLLVPMPIILLCCCRSRYFMIDPKGRSRENSDNEMDDEDMVSKATRENQRNRISDVMIDTNIPIKLLFLVNAFKIDDIIEHYKDTLSYATGDSNQIGQKLYELDYELQESLKDKDNAKEDKAKAKQNRDDKKKSTPAANTVDLTVNTQSFMKNGTDERPNNPQDKRNSSKRGRKEDNTDEFNNRSSMRDADSNRQLEFSPSKSNRDSSKTQMNMLDGPGNPLDDEENFKKLASSTQKLGRKEKNKRSRKMKKQDEDLDDEEEGNRKKQFYEGGEKERTNRNSKQNATGNSDMDFDEQNNNTAMSRNKSGQQQQQNKLQNNGNQEPRDNEEENEENESDLESIDTQLFVDEKKELIEDRDRLLLIFGNTLAFVLNVGLFIAVLASFIAGGYYDKRNQYVWVVVFFGAQLFSFFVSDIFVLWLMALSVTKCCRRKKTCLTKWMRESLYIYEDYKYVVTFANTRIT